VRYNDEAAVSSSLLVYHVSNLIIRPFLTLNHSSILPKITIQYLPFRCLHLQPFLNLSKTPGDFWQPRISNNPIVPRTYTLPLIEPCLCPCRSRIDNMIIRPLTLTQAGKLRISSALRSRHPDTRPFIPRHAAAEGRVDTAIHPNSHIACARIDGPSLKSVRIYAYLAE
jgi:hypothetical protein